MNQDGVLKIVSVVAGIVFILLSPICFYHLRNVTPTYSLYGGKLYVYIFPVLVLVNGILFIRKSQFLSHTIAVNLLFCVTFIGQELYNTLYHLVGYWRSQGFSIPQIILQAVEHVVLVYRHSLFLPSIALILLLLLFRPSRVNELRH